MGRLCDPRACPVGGPRPSRRPSCSERRVQVAVVAAFPGSSASAYRGVPSGLGLLFSVIAGLLAGPLANAEGEVLAMDLGHSARARGRTGR